MNDNYLSTAGNCTILLIVILLSFIYFIIIIVYIAFVIAPLIVFVIVESFPRERMEHEYGELESNLFAHSWRVCWRWIKSEAERALN